MSELQYRLDDETLWSQTANTAAATKYIEQRNHWSVGIIQLHMLCNWQSGKVKKLQQACTAASTNGEQWSV